MFLALCMALYASFLVEINCVFFKSNALSGILLAPASSMSRNKSDKAQTEGIMKMYQRVFLNISAVFVI